MKNSRRGTAPIVVLIWLALLVGWVMNVTRLFQCDFRSPCKAEVIRALGVPVFPLGGVIGYLHIDE